jgi:hypothetical protein
MRNTQKFSYLNYFKDNTIFRELHYVDTNTCNFILTDLVSILNKRLKYNSIRKLFEYQNISKAKFNYKWFE